MGRVFHQVKTSVTFCGKSFLGHFSIPLLDGVKRINLRVALGEESFLLTLCARSAACDKRLSLTLHLQIFDQCYCRFGSWSVAPALYWMRAHYFYVMPWLIGLCVCKMKAVEGSCVRTRSEGLKVRSDSLQNLCHYLNSLIRAWEGGRTEFLWTLLEPELLHSSKTFPQCTYCIFSANIFLNSQYI